MTTKRKAEIATSRQGLHFVKRIIEKHNCLFQEISLENDIGNDAYIEFVDQELATGCCIAVQIKSGKSFFKENGKAVFQSDVDHFEYWSSHLLPVCGIIVNPETGIAKWCDISKLLRDTPGIVKTGPFQVPAEKAFDESSYQEFKTHFLAYRELYAQNIGNALEAFSDLDDIERCFDGIRSLFSFHRNKFSAWYYIITCLKNFRGHKLLRYLVGALCHLPGHGDIFWSKQNTIKETVRSRALQFLRANMDREAILSLLEVVDEGAFSRGSIGQSVWAIIDGSKNQKSFLRDIAFDSSVNEFVRGHALWLSIENDQRNSPDEALGLISDYEQKFPRDDVNEFFPAMREQLKEIGYVAFFD